MKAAALLLVALSGCLAFERVPLYKMKTARTTLEVLYFRQYNYRKVQGWKNQLYKSVVVSALVVSKCNFVFT